MKRLLAPACLSMYSDYMEYLHIGETKNIYGRGKENQGRIWEKDKRKKKKKNLDQNIPKILFFPRLPDKPKDGLNTLWAIINESVRIIYVQTGQKET